MATTSSSKRQLIHTSNTYESNSDLTVGGDLFVNGATTTIDTANLLVEDKNIIIGNVSSPSDTTADGGGITLKGATDYTINWTDSTNQWYFNQGINITGQLDVSTNLNVGGYGTLTGLDINGNSQFDGAVTVGVNDTGHDVIFYGATSGRFLRWVQSEDRLKLADNTRLSLGGGNDLQLEFNGTHGYIKNNVGGSLYIQTANTIQLENAQGQDMLTASSGGAVKLFHGGNSTAKFETSTGGVTVNGKMTSDSITTALSLEVFASSGHNYISSQSSGSNLYIRNTGGGQILIRPKTSEEGIKLIPDGAVELYHDNAKKFETSSTGATITGNLVMGGGQIKFANGGHVMLGDSNDLRLYHDGNSYIAHDTEGDFFIQQNLADRDLVLQCDDGAGGTTDYFRLDGSDSIMKAHKKLRFLDNVKGTFGNSDDLQIYHDSSNSYIDNITNDLIIRNTSASKDIVFYSNNGTSTIESLRIDGSGQDLNSRLNLHGGDASLYPYITGFVATQNPEGHHIKCPYFFNDLAYARLRGAE